MKYIAEPYHLEGIQFLCTHPFAAMFADPGTGKTGMTLAAYTYLKKAGHIKRAMVIAPRLVVHNVWPAETQKFDQFNRITSTIAHGGDKDVSLFHDFIEQKSDLVLYNPEGVQWVLKMLKRKWFDKKMVWPWDSLIIDESSKFKNHGAERFKVLKPYLDLFKSRWILTGTPTPNSLHDIWAQMYIVDRGARLGKTITEFRKRFFQIDNPKFYSYKPLPGAAEKIYELISDVTIRFDESLFELPERVEKVVRVDLPQKARKVYDEFELQMFAELNETTITANTASSKYLLCRQIANGRFYEPTEPDQIRTEARTIHKMHSEKIEALGDILDELQGKPALIAYWFQHDLQALTEYLKKRFKSCPYIGHGVSVAETNKNIDAWNAGKLKTLVVHPLSMSHGLNLQSGGNDLIYYSLTDNLECDLQLNKRLHRRGVKGQVRIHRIVCNGTLDEAVLDRLNTKETNQKELLNAVHRYRQRKLRSIYGR